MWWLLTTHLHHITLQMPSEMLWYTIYFLFGIRQPSHAQMKHVRVTWVVAAVIMSCEVICFNTYVSYEVICFSKPWDTRYHRRFIVPSHTRKKTPSSHHSPTFIYLSLHSSLQISFRESKRVLMLSRSSVIIFYLSYFIFLFILILPLATVVLRDRW